MARTLLQKLGIKEDFKIHFINIPQNYFELLEESMPAGCIQVSNPKEEKVDFIHLFTNSIQELESSLPRLQNQIQQNGMIWVSWYKKSSKIPSEINEDIIRDTALNLKLVDVKVCSINSEWSALKLVIRKHLRV